MRHSELAGGSTDGSRNRIAASVDRAAHVDWLVWVPERNEQTEKEIPHADLLTTNRIDVNNVEFEMSLPPTTVDKKYDLYITILRKNRRY